MRELDAATRAHLRRECWLAAVCVLAGIAVIVYLEQPAPCEDFPQVFGNAVRREAEPLRASCPNCKAELPATPCWCPHCKLVYVSPGPQYMGCSPPAGEEDRETRLAKSD